MKQGWLFAVALGALPITQDQFKKFSDLSRSHVDESSHFDEVFKKAPSAASLRAVETNHLSDAAIDQTVSHLSTRARLEWALRDPSAWLKLDLDEIAAVADDSLKKSPDKKLGAAFDLSFTDDLLWAYLQGQTQDYFELRNSSWPVFFERLHGFVTKHPKILDHTEHKDWWKWFDSGEVEDPYADPRLRAVARYLQALSSHDADRQMEHLIEAAFVLSSHPLAQPYQSAFLAQVSRHYFEVFNRERALLAIASINKVKTEYIYLEPKIALLESLRTTAENRGLKDVAIHAVEEQSQLANELKIEGESPRILLSLADYYLSANRPDKALDAYLKVFPDETKLESWEAIEAYRGAALATLSLAQERRSDDRTRLREWAAEYLRHALNGGLATPYRDDLLANYGQVLSDLGRWKPSFDVYEALFTGGSTRETRLQGLTRGFDVMLEGMTKQNLSLDNKKIVLRRYLELLTSYSRSSFETETLKKYSAEGRDWAQRLALKDPATLATLNEIDAKAAKATRK